MSTRSKAQIGDTIIELVEGDITKQAVDAIVNAANSSLAGGGGVDGAIHRAAGAELVRASRKLAPCPTGEARITDGYKLPANYVIHGVGPVYSQYDDPSIPLASVHTYSLKLAQENNIKTIAFPAISTGIYGYPMDEAASVALRAVITYIKKHQPTFELVRFVLFSADGLHIFQQALTTLIRIDQELRPL